METDFFVINEDVARMFSTSIFLYLSVSYLAYLMSGKSALKFEHNIITV